MGIDNLEDVKFDDEFDNAREPKQPIQSDAGGNYPSGSEREPTEEFPEDDEQRRRREAREETEVARQRFKSGDEPSSVINTGDGAGYHTDAFTHADTDGRVGPGNPEFGSGWDESIDPNEGNGEQSSDDSEPDQHISQEEFDAGRVGPGGGDPS